MTDRHGDSFRAKCHASSCRSCGATRLEPVLDLGLMPLSDGLVGDDQLHVEDTRYPLEVAFCPTCTLVQILHTVEPEVLFCQDYPYYSSVIDTLMEHSRLNALELIDRHQLGSDSLVMEIASNDGYMLRNFAHRGIKVLGIDPAQGPVNEAIDVGVESLCAFFTSQLARRLRDDGLRPDIIIANNVLAHVADTNGFVEGIALLLKDSGQAVIECPYVRDLVDNCEFDTIYHEHLCYFSLTALDRLFVRHGLFINDIRHLNIHGGSLRIYVGKQEQRSEAVNRRIDDEQSAGVTSYGYYEQFSRRVEEIRIALRRLMFDLRSSGYTIAAYGAPAKGTILLNYLGLENSCIPFTVDRNSRKQGKYVPGVRIPIRDTSELLSRMPDYTLLLPWNFKDEILRQQQTYRSRGGRFIIPIPKPTIV